MKKLLACALSGLLLAGSASAEILTYSFTGSVFGINEGHGEDWSWVSSTSLPGYTISENGEVHGQFWIDTAQPLSCDGSEGRSCSYTVPGARTGVSVTLADGTVAGPSAASASGHLSTGASPDVPDNWYIDSASNDGRVEQWNSVLFAAPLGQSVIVDGSIPLSMLTLENNLFSQFSLYYHDLGSDSYSRVLGNLNTVTLIPTPAIPSAVPEPETYTMLGAGFALMALALRRRAAKTSMLVKQ